MESARKGVELERIRDGQRELLLLYLGNALYFTA